MKSFSIIVSIRRFTSPLRRDSPRDPAMKTFVMFMKGFRNAGQLDPGRPLLRAADQRLTVYEALF